MDAKDANFNGLKGRSSLDLNKDALGLILNARTILKIIFELEM